MDNLKFWNSVEKTNPNHTKSAKIGGGMSITAINATRQVKAATEKWGMYGSTWGLKDLNYNRIDGLGNDTILFLLNARFYYPEGSFEISSSVKLQSYNAKYKSISIDADFAKKVETDVLTKALSKLGFNSDVFMGLYDDNKYLSEVKAEFKEKEAKSAATDYLDKLQLAVKEMTNSKGIEEAKSIWSKYKVFQKEQLFIDAKNSLKK